MEIENREIRGICIYIEHFRCMIPHLSLSR